MSNEVANASPARGREIADVAAGRHIVDVAVAEGAIRRGDAVVTSDEAHIATIAARAGTALRIESI